MYSLLYYMNQTIYLETINIKDLLSMYKLRKINSILLIKIWQSDLITYNLYIALTRIIKSIIGIKARYK